MALQSALLWFCFRFTSMAMAWNFRKISLFGFTVFLGVGHLPALVKNSWLCCFHSPKCLGFSLDLSFWLSTFYFFLSFCNRLQNTWVPSYFLPVYFCLFQTFGFPKSFIKMFNSTKTTVTSFLQCFKENVPNNLEFPHCKWHFEISPPSVLTYVLPLYCSFLLIKISWKIIMDILEISVYV